jgi:hypothetical protein
MEFRQKVEVKFARETERWGYTNRSKKEKIHHSLFVNYIKPTRVGIR